MSWSKEQDYFIIKLVIIILFTIFSYLKILIFIEKYELNKSKTISYLIYNFKKFAKFDITTSFSLHSTSHKNKFYLSKILFASSTDLYAKFLKKIVANP